MTPCVLLFLKDRNLYSEETVHSFHLSSQQFVLMDEMFHTNEGYINMLISCVSFFSLTSQLYAIPWFLTMFTRK